MREAEGGGMLVYLVVFFVGIVMLFFVGILAYTKAYKAKNRVVEIIESNVDCATNRIKNDNVLIDEINSSLKTMGYQMGTCPNNGNAYTTNYKVCIEQKKPENGVYYKVTTYVHFDLPVVNNSVNIPVTSETKIMCKKYDY